MDATIGEAWEAIAARLQARKRELVAAVRDYPTPIARCDIQLPEAIERRDLAARDCADALELEEKRAVMDDREWRERTRALARRLAATDDPALRAACEKLLAEMPSA